MSADPEAPGEAEAAESAQTAQTATQEPATQVWEDGQPFDPDRAKSTIAHLRERERELKAQADEFRRIQEDEGALTDWLRRKGFDIEDDDPEPDPEPNAPQVVTDPRIDAIEARLGQEQFEKDFQNALGDREVTGVGRTFIEDQTVKGGNNPQALQAAVKEWFDYVDTLAAPAPKRTAPHVPKGGSTPSGPDKPTADMTTAEKERYILERLQAEAG